MHTEFTSKDGTRIGGTRYGAGPPLVLAHGGTADHSRWAPIMSTLEQRFTVYAIDRRGRGRSGDTGSYSIEREFDDVAAVVAAIPGPVDLLGHSYGAICALEASLRVKNLRRLVLYEPPIDFGCAPPGVADRLIALLEAGDHDGMVATALMEAARVPAADIAILRTQPAWAARVASAHTFLRELLACETYVFDPSQFAAMRVPALLLLGGASPPLFRSATERLHAALPDARVAVLPGQQHVAIDTAPDMFLREVLRFLG